MSTLEYLRKELGERAYRSIPPAVKKKFIKLDELPPAPQRLTAKRLEEALR